MQKPKYSAFYNNAIPSTCISFSLSIFCSLCRRLKSLGELVIIVDCVLKIHNNVRLHFNEMNFAQNQSAFETIEPIFYFHSKIKFNSRSPYITIHSQFHFEIKARPSFEACHLT